MAYKVFESFLEKHKAEVIERFIPQMQKTAPWMGVEEASIVTEQLITFFIGRMLGTINIGDPLAQTIIAGALSSNINREMMMENTNVFFSSYRSLCAQDLELNNQEREHIERMLDQSYKFFITDMSIVKPQNLKPQQ